MLQILIIFILGLAPSAISLLTRRQAEARARARLRSAMQSAALRRLPTLPIASDLHEFNGVGLPIGDQTCQFNARSAFVRCAVNPSGPCQDCPHYQQRQ